MQSKKNKPVAVVTGGRAGIGQAICFALAEQGFDIAIGVRDVATTSIDKTIEGCSLRGGQAIGFPCDIKNLDSHQVFLSAILKKFKRIDCLINNAGVSVLSRGDLLDVSEKSYDLCLDVNLKGTFFLTQTFARYFLETKSSDNFYRSIINITSANSEAISTNRGEYCVSKAGLSMVSKLFSVRLAESGIGVFEVRPGIIETEMTAPSKQKYDDFFANDGAPMARWGRPEDVANAVQALAKGEVNYSVGQVINIDGGLNLPRF